MKGNGKPSVLHNARKTIMSDNLLTINCMYRVIKKRIQNESSQQFDRQYLYEIKPIIMLCLVNIKHYNIFLPVSSSPKCSVGFPSVSGFNIWRVYLTSWFLISSSSGSGSDRQTDWSTNMIWYRWGVGWASTFRLPVEFTSLSGKKIKSLFSSKYVSIWYWVQY